MKIIVKKILGVLIGNPFVFNLAKILNRRKLLILYYHRVIDGSLNENPAKDLAVSSASFEEQMRILKSDYNCVSEDDIIIYIKNNAIFPNNTVWITFDDGYEDNYRVAYPILKKYGLSASIFLTTGYINNTHSYKDYRFLNWEQIAEMRKSNISFGAHTVSHPVLSSITTETGYKEIRDSKEEIERNLGTSVNTFAFPKGKSKHYSFREYKTVLDELDIKVAVSTVGGYNNLREGNLSLNLKRIGTSYEDPINFFKGKLALGAFWQF